MIVTADGYVLTNKHVIENATNVTVVMSDGALHENVKVVAEDPVNDVAFLKIADVQGLIPVELGNSGSISIGQSVVAIGNALGQYKNTVTAGIVSGTGRSISASTGSGDSSQSSAPLTDLIQTDAAINPGNSGGPLVNAAGQVIGINTAIVQGANGIGFAIPINSTKGMLASLIRDGEAQRAFLGVSFVPITPSVARELELSVSRGAYVFVENGTAVLSGGPADKAGIRDRDIITKVGDRVVGVNGDLSNLVAEHSVGDQVEIALLRGGEEMTVRVTLGAFPVRQ
jgi:serine protease Do